MKVDEVKRHSWAVKSDKVFSKFIKLQKGILTESLSSGNKILTNLNTSTIVEKSLPLDPRALEI